MELHNSTYSYTDSEPQEQASRVIFNKAVAAGFLIGIGVMINSLLTIPVLGAIFFSIGLLMIIHFQFQLFTGKIGTLEYTVNDYIFMFGANFIGMFFCILFGVLAFPALIPIILAAAKIKFSKDIVMMFFSAFFCGILVHLACKSNNKILTIMAVATFILLGAEHCIAIIPYFMFIANWNNLIKFFIIILGNSLGAITTEKIAFK